MWANLSASISPNHAFTWQPRFACTEIYKLSSRWRIFIKIWHQDPELCSIEGTFGNKYVWSKTAARWPTHRYYSSKQCCSTNHILTDVRQHTILLNFKVICLSKTGTYLEIFRFQIFSPNWKSWIRTRGQLQPCRPQEIQFWWKDCELLNIMNYW